MALLAEEDASSAPENWGQTRKKARSRHRALEFGLARSCSWHLCTLEGVRRPRDQPFDHTFTVPDYVEEFGGEGVARPFPSSLEHRAEPEARPLKRRTAKCPEKWSQCCRPPSRRTGGCRRARSAAKETLEAGTEVLKDAASDVLNGRSADPVSDLKTGLSGLLGGKKDDR